MKTAVRLLGSFLAAAVLTLAPAGDASAAPPVPQSEALAQCALAPGVYLITTVEGRIVGYLLVYPDCTTEVLPKP